VLDFLGNLKRTHYCGALRASDAGRDATVMGWVHRRRDLGNLLFLDVRDRSGIVQVVFNKETQPEAHAKAELARSEFVVAVEGRVTRREKANPELATGEIDLVATKLHILNNAKTPPFPIEEEINAAEETRLRFRFLDLRRPRPHRNLAFDTGRSARLFGAEPRASRAVLCAAAIAADFQADFDDWRAGPVFPDCEVFPGRGFARGPATGVYAVGRGDVVSAAGRYFQRDRECDGAGVRGGGD
jgi:hypothetical protein